MSSRSAYARKKATDAKSKKPSSHSHPPSPPSSNSDDHIPDFPLPPGYAGHSTINPRHLAQTPQMNDLHRGGWGHNGMHMMIGDTRRDVYMSRQFASPTYEWTLTRRTPVSPSLRTEEYSAIEKSGLRSLLDKRSDGVRRGLANTFSFRKKEKDDEMHRGSSVDRPWSEASTASSPVLHQEENYSLDRYIHAPLPQNYPLPSPPSPQSPWSISQSPQSVCSIPPSGPPPKKKLPPIPSSGVKRRGVDS